MQYGTQGAGQPGVNRLANYDCVIRDQEVSVFILGNIEPSKCMLLYILHYTVS